MLLHIRLATKRHKVAAHGAESLRNSATKGLNPKPTKSPAIAVLETPLCDALYRTEQHISGSSHRIVHGVGKARSRKGERAAGPCWAASQLARHFSTRGPDTAP
jgi:hypothetical protein